MLVKNMQIKWLTNIDPKLVSLNARFLFLIETYQVLVGVITNEKKLITWRIIVIVGLHAVFFPKCRFADRRFYTPYWRLRIGDANKNETLPSFLFFTLIVLHWRPR